MLEWRLAKLPFMTASLRGLLAGCLATMALPATGQTQESAPQPNAAPPTITVEDALVRARQYGGQIQSANFAAQQAKQDSVQARAARLPTLNAFNQFIYTEGNGTPSGVFVANDGVHIYNEQAVVYQGQLGPAPAR